MLDRCYLFALAALGVWRIAHLVTSEDGPGRVFVRARRFASGSAWSGLFECLYCLSVWVAIPFALAIGSDVRERLLLWPALSAAAILLERVTSGASAPATYFEHVPEHEGDLDHVMLRTHQ